MKLSKEDIQDMINRCTKAFRTTPDCYYEDRNLYIGMIVAYSMMLDECLLGNDILKYAMSCREELEKCGIELNFTLTQD